MAFNEADTAHGLVKRRLVKGYCGGLFARELESTKFKRVPSGHYCVQYVDAFSWRGEYGGPTTRNSQSLTDEHKDDIEKMGSPIIALDRGLDRCKVMTKRSLSFPSQILLAIHFIFNDISSENISHLKKLVVEVLKSYNWEEEKDNVDGYKQERDVQQEREGTCSDYLGLSGTILQYLALSWTILDYLGTIWDYLGLSGTIFDNLELSWIISDCLGLSQTIWDYLEVSGSILDYMGQS